ncbi:MAG TPA: CHRD domain-containing protein, partial [Candidatus Eisenbacteria bacterium]
FSGLLGTTTAAHIHAPTAVPLAGTAGVATTTPSFVGFPLGVTSGSYMATLNTLNSSSYNPSYVTANGGTAASAEAALFAAIRAGRAYFNIHSTSVGSGEIRAFLIPTPTPVEPASWSSIKKLLQ